MRYVSKVKWFSNRRGFGFLNPLTDDGDDVAIHHSEIERDFPGQYVRLEEGDAVSFELQQHDKGPRAVLARRENGYG